MHTEILVRSVCCVRTDATFVRSFVCWLVCLVGRHFFSFILLLALLLLHFWTACYMYVGMDGCRCMLIPVVLADLCWIAINRNLHACIYVHTCLTAQNPNASNALSTEVNSMCINFRTIWSCCSTPKIKYILFFSVRVVCVCLLRLFLTLPLFFCCFSSFFTYATVLCTPLQIKTNSIKRCWNVRGLLYSSSSPSS